MHYVTHAPKFTSSHITHDMLKDCGQLLMLSSSSLTVQNIDWIIWRRLTSVLYVPVCLVRVSLPVVQSSSSLSFLSLRLRVEEAKRGEELTGSICWCLNISNRHLLHSSSCLSPLLIFILLLLMTLLPWLVVRLSHLLPLTTHLHLVM